MDATYRVIVAEAGKFGKPQFSRGREKLCNLLDVKRFECF
jgi:hypothetical protein